MPVSYLTHQPTLSLISPYRRIRERRRSIVKLVFEERGEVPYYSIIYKRSNELR